MSDNTTPTGTGDNSTETPGTLEVLGTAPAASALGVMDNPTKPPKKKVNQSLTTKRMLTAGLSLPLFLMILLPLLMTGMTSDLKPHGMDVAVIGSEQVAGEMTEQLQTSAAGSYDVSRVDTVDEATDMLQQQDLRGAYDPTTNTMYQAGAAGVQPTQAATAFFTQVSAQQGGETPETVDVQPLSDNDPLGTSVIFIGLGTILGGFMSGMILGLMPVKSVWRIVLGLVMPAVVATGLVIMGWGICGVFDSGIVGPWLMMYLTGLTCLSVMVGGMLVIGPVMMPLAILLMPMLGIASSGVSAAFDMASSFYGFFHPWLFSSQGISGIRDAIYFPEVSAAHAVVTMLIWLVVGIVLAVIGTVRQKRRHLFAMSDQKRMETLAVAGAVAA
ncbi:hypothetical protein [Corynebacterium variabile]|uniref:hypothetical protein n=1 Tax=Corynebacterium variabile TaxID=1727 RepID=UPI0028AE1679|nr:hypothetical protein [Corynebacterium variabile]